MFPMPAPFAISGLTLVCLALLWAGLRLAWPSLAPTVRRNIAAAAMGAAAAAAATLLSGDAILAEAAATLRRSEAVVALLRGATRLGDMPVRAAIVIAGAFVLWRQRAATAEMLAPAIALAGSEATVWALKYGIGRARPVFETAEAATSPAFPSAHAGGAAVLYLLIALLASRRLAPGSPGRIDIWGTAALVVVLVAASRIVLSVHFPSDVGAGLLIGGAWAAAAGLWLARNART